MYKEIFINFRGKKTSILIDCLHEDKKRVPCFVVGLSSHYHDKFSPKFRSNYQLILIDLYWTDSSYDSNYIKKLTLKDMANHIEEIRQAMENTLGKQYSKVVMLGHSAYGLLCLEYALHYKTHVYGIINVCTPPYFKENVLQEFQTKYINSNFGPKAPGGLNQRYIDYYLYTAKHQQSIKTVPAKTEKEKFVRWYISMGPILWKERPFWQDKNNQATAIWNPWSIRLVHSVKNENNTTVRDVNMTMFNHYFELITKIDCRPSLNKIGCPVLWFVGLYDARVSMYFFNRKNFKVVANNLISNKIELYYTDTGHWPMYEKNRNEFDAKTECWLKQVCQQDVENEKNRKSLSKL